MIPLVQFLMINNGVNYRDGNDEARNNMIGELMSELFDIMILMTLTQMGRLWTIV